MLCAQDSALRNLDLDIRNASVQFQDSSGALGYDCLSLGHSEDAWIAPLCIGKVIVYIYTLDDPLTVLTFASLETREFIFVPILFLDLVNPCQSLSLTIPKLLS